MLCITITWALVEMQIPHLYSRPKNLYFLNSPARPHVQHLLRNTALGREYGIWVPRDLSFSLIFSLLSWLRFLSGALSQW